MRRATLLRATTMALAFLHTFPARKHLGLFVAAPSLSEGWKGFGALIAIGLYLLPVSVQARGLHALWRRWPIVLRGLGALLAVAHFVPALDHLPRLMASPSWGDAWRGVGSGMAVLWFATPLAAQGRLIAALARFARLPLARGQRIAAARS